VEQEQVLALPDHRLLPARNISGLCRDSGFHVGRKRSKNDKVNNFLT
jgi:hypothetical protein